VLCPTAKPSNDAYEYSNSKQEKNQMPDLGSSAEKDFQRGERGEVGRERRTFRHFREIITSNS
jgi:hypothetical protein